MRKIWGYKIVQLIVFILIVLSLGIITSNLETVQFVLQNGELSLEEDIIEQLIENVKTVRIIAVILWGLLIGLYLNFIYSINRKVVQKTLH